MTLQNDDLATATANRVAIHEDMGLRWCHTCSAWEDDTECYPDDHSRHCGHEVKPVGLGNAFEYRLICTHRLERLAPVIKN